MAVSAESSQLVTSMGCPLPIQEVVVEHCGREKHPRADELTEIVYKSVWVLCSIRMCVKM